MLDDDRAAMEDDLGMTENHMFMLMAQHIEQCPVEGNHEANVDQGTGAVVWGPCTEAA